jgi:hypothetical protein
MEIMPCHLACRWADALKIRGRNYTKTYAMRCTMNFVDESLEILLCVCVCVCVCDSVRTCVYEKNVALEPEY